MAIAMASSLFSMAEIPTNQDCDLRDAQHIELKWDQYASEKGLYTVSTDSVTCVGASPKLHLNAGQTYTFHQTDISNWYHPVGFAYEPGGAHNDCGDGSGECPELGGEDSGTTLQYYVDDVPVKDDESTFGLDAYEPLFFHPQEDWKGYKFKVDLIVPNVKSFYYFCHIHATMSAMVEVHGESDDAKAPERHDDFFVAPPAISAMDEKCGTVGVSDFVDKYHDHTCQDKAFLCGSNLDSTFNKCMHAIDCKMHHDMAVHTDDDPVKTFMRQMIPHHANAVSMAKILLKHSSVDDVVAAIARSIINVQNHQIQEMQDYLDDAAADYGKKCYETEGCPRGCKPASSRRLLFAASPKGDDNMRGSGRRCPRGCVAA
jgi:hypothetical protein